jgi:hypothetical protein
VTEPSHVALLATSRELLYAIVGDDAEVLASVVSRLRVGLAAHIDAEDPLIDALPMRAQTAVRRGQQMLLVQLDDLSADLATVEDSGTGRRLSRAAALHLALRRQAVLEALVLRRQRRRRGIG